MSGITDLAASRAALREVARVVKFTRQELAARMQQNIRSDWLLSRSQSGQFSTTLNHLEDVREGFILSQRTSSSVSITELRALIKDILLDWRWITDLNLSLAPSPNLEIVDQQLVSYNHALVALAVVPRLPAAAVTFPQRQPTYSDMSVPALPGELLTRIEEIERIIYQAEIGPVKSTAYEPLRRTYAFFEASSWLVSNYLEPLLDD